MSSQIGSLGAAGSAANTSIINPQQPRQQGVKTLPSALESGGLAGAKQAGQAVRTTDRHPHGGAGGVQVKQASDPISLTPKIGSLIDTTA